MSIVDRINQNTQSVLYGKREIETAITAKGGTVGGYVDIPSFMNLVDGINSIGASQKINGPTAKVLANHYLNQGDVCTLLTNYGENTLKSNADFPTTMKTEDSSGNVTTETAYYTCMSSILNDGEIIFVSYVDGSCYMCPFIKVNGVYEQMKINNRWHVYKNTTTAYAANQAIINTAYDKKTDTIYAIGSIGASNLFSSNTKIYKLTIDRANKNLIATDTTLAGYFAVQGGNGHFFSHTYLTNGMITALPVNVSKSTGACSWGTNLYSSIGISTTANASLTVLDAAQVAEDVVIAVVKYYNPSTAKSSLYAVKFSVSDTGLTYVKHTLIQNGTAYGGVVNVDNSGEFVTSRANITNSGVIFSVDASGVLHKYNVNIATLAYTEAPLTFSDGLSISKMTIVRPTKDDEYLLAFTSDTTYTSAKRHRLYRYDAVNDLYHFVCTPTSAGSNPQAKNQISRNRSSYVETIDMLCYDDKSGGTHLYSPEVAEYEYMANINENNKLEDNANAYGIATKDITMGEIGEVVVVVKK